MGIVPLWGFQLMIAIGLSFVFKLNKALVIIAANISIPPMIPVILFLSHLTGALWMGENAQSIVLSADLSLEILRASAFQYIIGAVSLATLAGIGAGLLTFGLLKIFKRS